jgi:hypothetical protein
MPAREAKWRAIKTNQWQREYLGHLSVSVMSIDLFCVETFFFLDQFLIWPVEENYALFCMTLKHLFSLSIKQ